MLNFCGSGKMKLQYKVHAYALPGVVVVVLTALAK